MVSCKNFLLVTAWDQRTLGEHRFGLWGVYLVHKLLKMEIITSTDIDLYLCLVGLQNLYQNASVSIKIIKKSFWRKLLKVQSPVLNTRKQNCLLTSPLLDLHLNNLLSLPGELPACLFGFLFCSNQEQTKLDLLACPWEEHDSRWTKTQVHDVHFHST